MRKPVKNIKKFPDKFSQMTLSPLGPLIFRLSLPAVVANIIGVVYNLTDTFYLGRLGTDAAAVVAKFRTHMPQRFTVAQGKIQAAGALFEIDPNTGKCLSVKRITF